MSDAKYIDGALNPQYFAFPELGSDPDSDPLEGASASGPYHHDDTSMPPSIENISKTDAHIQIPRLYQENQDLKDQLKVAHTTLEHVTRSLKHKDEQIQMLNDNSRKRAKENKRLHAALSAMQKDEKLESGAEESLSSIDLKTTPLERMDREDHNLLEQLQTELDDLNAKFKKQSKQYHHMVKKIDRLEREKQDLISLNQGLTKKIHLLDSEENSMLVSSQETSDVVWSRDMVKVDTTSCTKCHHKIQEKDAEIRGLEADLQATHKKLVASEEKSIHTEEKLSFHELQFDALRTQYTKILSEMETLTAAKNELTEQCDALMDQVRTLETQTQYESLDSEKSEVLFSRATEIDKLAKAAQSDEKLENYKMMIDNLTEQVRCLESKNDRLDSDLRNRDTKIKKLETDVEYLEPKNKSLEEKKEQLEEMLSTTTETAEAQSSEIHTLNLKHMELVQEVEKYKSKMDDKEAQIAELDEKLADLQSVKVQHVVFSENSKDVVPSDQASGIGAIQKIELNQLEMRQQIEKYRAKLKDRDGQIDALKDEVKILNDRQDVNKSDSLGAAGTNSTLEADHKKLRSDYDELNNEFRKLMSDYHDKLEDEAKLRKMIPKSDLLMAQLKTLEQQNEELEQLCRERENQQGDDDNVNIFKEQARIYEQDFNEERKAREEQAAKMDDLERLAKVLQEEKQQLQNDLSNRVISSMDRRGAELLEETNKKHMIALSQLNDEVKDLTAQKQALEIQLNEQAIRLMGTQTAIVREAHMAGQRSPSPHGSPSRARPGMGTSPGSPAGAWGVTPTPAQAYYPPGLGYTPDRKWSCSKCQRKFLDVSERNTHERKCRSTTLATSRHLY